jgi:predicted nuclease of restriction endonuclease-like (RecB) superfamily
MQEIGIALPSKLLDDVRSLINNARIRVASTANIETTLLYWNIGHRINADVLDNKRATYGKQIVSQLASQLKQEYGGSYNLRNIQRMMQFAEEFPDFQIVTQVASQLSWSHFLEIFPIKDTLQREFYLTMAAHEGWGRNLLREKIDGMLFERTAISTKPEETIRADLVALKRDNVLSPDLVFKSPYFLDFTGLRGAYSEKSLEDVLINELEHFILELGNGFSFVERQKRMIIDGEDFYLDMLFYHRKLRRLVAIDLKLGRFKAAYKGQMELYLNWLNKYERQPGEDSPLRLILCAKGGSEQIELLELNKSGIRVAQYYTELPDREQLIGRLRRAIEIAKEKGLK